MFLHMALFCAPLKIKYHIYVYLVFKFIINEVVSLKILVLYTTGARGWGTKQITIGTVRSKRKGTFNLNCERISLNIKQLPYIIQEEYNQSLVDFFDLENQAALSMIAPTFKLLRDYKMDKRWKDHINLIED